MSFPRLSARFVVLAGLLSFALWGTACTKKSKTKDRTGPVVDPGKSDGSGGGTFTGSNVDKSGKSGDGKKTSEAAKTGKTPAGTAKTNKTAGGTANAKKTEVPPKKKSKRKVNDNPPPKTQESGSTTKKRRRRRVGDRV